MKRIIILDRKGDATIFCVVFWAVVPPALRPFFANADKVSAWPGASALENTALKNGEIVESIDYISVPGNATIPQIKTQLEQRWTKYQDEINNWVCYSRYGTYWDGITWVDAGA